MASVLLMLMLMAVFVGVVCVGGAQAAQLSTTRMRVQHLTTPTVAPGEPIAFSWIPTSSDRNVLQQVFQITIRASHGAIVYDSGKIESSDMSFTYSGEHLSPASRYSWSVQWWSQTGAVASVRWSTFHTGIAWNGASGVNSSWLSGETNMLRKEFNVASPPTEAAVYISGLGYFQLFVNGLRIDSSMLTGTWTTYSQQYNYWTYDVSHILKVGKNSIGVLLGHGWRDVSAFTPHPATSCDRYERLLRAEVYVNKNQILVTDGTWQGTANGPVLSDSVYNGETYDARLEQPGWTNPGFRPAPTAGWRSATVVSCFNPRLTPISIPEIELDKINKPVKITQPSSCAGNMIGGLIDENANLTLQCAPNSGLIQTITFASFGTPNGTCGQYKLGNCNAKDTLSIVQSLCVGKTSCVIPASDKLFGDPCYGIAKQLAVSASGCRAPTRYVVDFGENLSGFVRLRVKGSTGTTVTLRHAEVLMHEPYGPADGNIYTGNLRSALATDTYILKGDPNGEIYEPHFTYHGFQFVEVDNYPGVLTADNITQLHFRSLVRERVKFNSSSPILNAIQYNALKGQGSNMMSVPTDCDQRDERLGWMGDADLTADSFSINYDFASFQDNFLDQMVISQGQDGSLPDVVPFYRYGGDPADVSWSAAFPQNVYVRFKINGDLAPASKHWESLMLYMSNLAEQLKNAGGHINQWKTPYGDWVPAGPKVANELCTGFSYIVNLRQMVELATALNHTTDATNLQNTLNNVVNLYNQAFYKSGGKCYDNCGQSSYAMSLLSGAAPAAEQDEMMTALINDIVNTQKNHVTVGIIGAKALFQLLKERNHVQVGIDLAEQTTYPSWGYMHFNNIEPATSNTWELWDSPTEGPGMNSRNHHMFSSISEFIVTTAGGIDEFSCKRLSVLRPARVLGISWAHTSAGVECGDVHLSYRRAGGVQCAKVPEGRSEVNPMLPVVEDVVLSCGPDGGVITSIDFASWGFPDGTCGAFVSNSTCDATSLIPALSAKCVGQSECVLSSRATDYPSANCPGPHRLFAQATCSGSHGVQVDVSVPVGQQETELWIPHHGHSNPTVVDMQRGGVSATVFSLGTFTPSDGVRAVHRTEDVVVVSLAPGAYSLRLSTNN